MQGWEKDGNVRAAENVYQNEYKIEIDLEWLICWLWLDFPNLPHFLSDFVGIWSGMTYNVDFWLEFQNLPPILKDLLQIVRIWNSSTFFFLDFGWIWKVLTVDFGWNSKIFHTFFT